MDLTIRGKIMTLVFRNNYIKFLLVLTLSVLPVYADIVSSSFEKGNLEYDAGNYLKAIEQYDNVVRSGYESGEIYYNLGNAYYKAGDIVNAVVFYERAKRLIYNDEDLNINLGIVNLSLVDRVDEIPVLAVTEFVNELKYGSNVYNMREKVVFLSILLSVLLSVFLLLNRGAIKAVTGVASSL